MQNNSEIHRRTAVIVQARYGSTRLPGKVLKTLAGHTVLEHVLHRCAAIPSADVVCCAVPTTSDSDEVANLATKYGAEVYRGNEQDVLDRYYQAARMLNADVILRVTSDCPLIDPDLCDAVLRLRAARNADYACNNMPRRMPHGLDCEAFTFRALEKAAHEARDPASREHVTPWLRNRPEFSRCNLDAGGAGLGLRWTLDFPEDFLFFTELFAKLPPWPTIPTTAEVITLLDKNPNISAINRHLGESATTK